MITAALPFFLLLIFFLGLLYCHLYLSVYLSVCLSRTMTFIDLDRLVQGFSTFRYLSSPKSILYPFAYPQTKIDSFGVPPQPLLFTFCQLILIRLKILRTQRELLAYPQGYPFPSLIIAGLVDLYLAVCLGFLLSSLSVCLSVCLSARRDPIKQDSNRKV